MRQPPPNVLCVFDDVDACDVIASTLPLLNFTFAHSFASGLAHIRAGIFDIYLLDECIPDASGIVLCREIRRTDANTPVVLLSPAWHSGDRDGALAAGASAYLDMPADFFRLEGTVIGLIRQSEARSLDARMAEIAAFQEEIKERLEGLNARLRTNAELTLIAIDHLLRARAYATFLESGGIRAHFERLWPQVLDNLVCGQARSATSNPASPA